MLGIASQATNSTFWKDTNGAAEGVLFEMFAAPETPVTPKTVPFANAFKARFGNFPAYSGYTAYDEVYYIADAIKRAGSTDSDKLVQALEKTDWEGTLGRIQFYGRNEEFTHSIKYGPGLVSGILLEWHDGKQLAVWPEKLANGQISFPKFIKLPPS